MVADYLALSLLSYNLALFFTTQLCLYLLFIIFILCDLALLLSFIYYLYFM